ncbi:hypothetical protein CUMW_004000 [Citrus unshiu]|nr:hypothetical protein CUMW_004000 [Citrus unshiu]
MRGRSYSYSPSPPRDYGRRYRSPSPRGHYGGRGRDLPTTFSTKTYKSICRPEDLRGPFGQFGRLKDIYLPRDYYTGSRSYDRRQSPPRYSRSPHYARGYSRSPDYYSPPPRRGRDSRSISPRYRRYRERSYSRSPYGSRSYSPSRSRSRSLDYSR